jgi:transcriptional regulator with XRE-family HTH domain
VSPRRSTPLPEIDNELGRRIRTFRKRRGLSLDVVAGLAGITKQYLSLIERGERHISDRRMLGDICDAIGCSIIDVTGEPYSPTDQRSANALSTIPPIQLALLDCDLDDVPDDPVRPIEQLEQAVREAHLHCVRTRYEIAGRDLGQMLVELQIIAATGDEQQQRRALGALVEACKVAYGITKNLGHTQLAVDAAARGLDAARRLDNPTLLGFARWYYALALLRIGARRRATSILSTALNDLSGIADPSAPHTLTTEVYGMVHLTSALGAARSGRADEARSHLAEARDLAGRTGERNGLRLNFGPANVRAWTLSVGVDLGEGAAAVEKVQPDSADLSAFAESPDRIAAWHYDLARALAQEGGSRDHEAIRYLDIAERTAPQRVHHDPMARELLFQLNGRALTARWELTSLQNRFGIHPN